MKEMTISAVSANELAQKLCKLYNCIKKSISCYKITFTNFESFYYNRNQNGVYVKIIDTNYRLNKAKKLGII